MDVKSKEICLKPYACNGRQLSFTTPLLMAVINLTPDSFYDGGRYYDLNSVLRDAEEKVNAGAHIIDLGPASSRPGAALLSAAEEWSRLQEPLRILRRSFPDTFLSVDTWQSEVAKRAAGEGADLINDISGGALDPAMPATIASLDLPYITMHMDGTPQTMNRNPAYQDVVNSVVTGLQKRIAILEEKGFQKIIIDPGFGFGKSLQNNYQLLKGLPRLRELGYPVLAGLSRKSMISKVAGTNPVTSLNGTTVLNTVALLNGANILRVHDVTEARQTIDLINYYRSA